MIEKESYWRIGKERTGEILFKPKIQSAFPAAKRSSAGVATLVPQVYSWGRNISCIIDVERVHLLGCIQARIVSPLVWKEWNLSLRTFCLA